MHFSFQSNLCDSCHDSLPVCILIILIPPVKGNSYRIHFWGMSEDEAISLMKKADLNEKSKYINSN